MLGKRIPGAGADLRRETAQTHRGGRKYRLICCSLGVSDTTQDEAVCVCAVCV